MNWIMTSPAKAAKPTERRPARLLFAEVGCPTSLLTKYEVAGLARIRPVYVNTLFTNMRRGGRESFSVAGRTFYLAAEKLPGSVRDAEKILRRIARAA